LPQLDHQLWTNGGMSYRLIEPFQGRKSLDVAIKSILDTLMQFSSKKKHDAAKMRGKNMMEFK
jgi:hypothetical protein